MNQDELTKRVDLHHKWIRKEPGGKRLVLVNNDLSGSNLSGSDLRYSDLRGSDLSCCDLSCCDLRCCDLRYSNLSGSDLSYSNLSCCDLRDSDLRDSNLSCCVGFLLLPVQDMRGHSFPHASWIDGEWRVRAGCRDFTIAEARKHWGEAYDGERSIGDLYLYAIDWLERQPVPSGNAGD